MASKQEYLIVQKSKVNELELLFSIDICFSIMVGLIVGKKEDFVIVCMYFKDVSSSGLLKTSLQLSLNSFFNIFAFLSLSCFLHLDLSVVLLYFKETTLKYSPRQNSAFDLESIN